MPSQRLKTAIVAVLVVAAGWQLSAVTLSALPPNRYSDAVSSETDYLSPFFNQNWRLFAPNPVSEDRTIAFQGSYRTADGQIKQTPWVDWTAVELDLIQHRLVGGRAGYVTNKLFSPLESRYDDLDPAQRVVADQSSADAPTTWKQLGSKLDPDRAVPGQDTALFLRYERATIELGTGVLMSRFPDRSLLSVRYAARKQPVTPYAERSGTDKQREAARPPLTERLSGWRVPEPGSSAQRSAIASFDRRHR